MEKRNGTIQWHVMSTEPLSPPKKKKKEKEKQTRPTVLKFFNPQASNLLLEPLRLETKNMQM